MLASAKFSLFFFRSGATRPPPSLAAAHRRAPAASAGSSGAGVSATGSSAAAGSAACECVAVTQRQNHRARCVSTASRRPSRRAEPAAPPPQRMVPRAESAAPARRCGMGGADATHWRKECLSTSLFRCIAPPPTRGAARVRRAASACPGDARAHRLLDGRRGRFRLRRLLHAVRHGHLRLGDCGLHGRGLGRHAVTWMECGEWARDLWVEMTLQQSSLCQIALSQSNRRHIVTRFRFTLLKRKRFCV